MATNNSLPIGGFGLNGSGNPNALTNQPGMMKLPAGMSPMTLNPNGSVGTNQTSTAGLFSNANGSPVKGAGAPLTFSQGLMNSAVNSSSPVVNGGGSSTSGAGTGGSNAGGNNNQNNQNGGGSTGTSTADLNAAHQAKVDAITKQISDLQGQLKTKQDQEATNVASYPSGTTPQKDANGDTIPYVAPTQNQQAVSGLLTQANQSPAYTDAIAAENAAQQKITDLRNQEGTALGQIGGAGSPQTSGSAAGSAMTTQSEFQNEIANAQSTLTQAQQQAQQAISEQGAQTTAGNEAASQTSPIGAAPIMNPQTGQLINPGLVQDAMIAVQADINKGADINNDPNIQKIASSMGFLGSTAILDMANKLGVSTTAQSAASQQNASTGQSFQNQGAVLQATLTGMDGYGKQLQTIMGLSGANPFSTNIANQTYSNYFTNVNPSAKDSINAYLAEVKNSASQIIASSTGVNPIEVTNMLNSYDFTQLSPKQLNDFMQNIDAAGQTKLSTYQQGKNASYGGNIGYSGNTANPNAPVNGGTANSPIVAGAATGATAFSGLFNDIMNALGANATTTVSGAAGGLATKMFGG